MDREERRNYENDVFYEVWRSGGDPDRIDFDGRVEDHFYNGDYPEDAAAHELRCQQPSPPEPEYEEPPEG